MAAVSFHRSISPSIDKAESMVIREGLSFARELGFQDLEVQSDGISDCEALKE